MMIIDDMDRQIQRLKSKRTELCGKINSTRNFDVKEMLKEDLAKIDSQLKILEEMKKKV